MQVDNRSKQAHLAIALSKIAAQLGEELNLNGAETIEATVYALAMTCCDFTQPQDRGLCITEASKLLLTYATPVTVDSPLQPISTH